MPKDEKEKLVPNLRFKGFTDDWIQKKLGEYVTFYSGLTYSPKDVIESDDGVLVLRSSNIQDDKLDFVDNVYVKTEVVNSKYVEINDIVVVVRNGSRRLLGKHTIIKTELQNTVIGAFMTGIQAESPDFVNSLLSTTTFKKEMHKDLGATINQITNKSFRNMSFYIPNNEEANIIGRLFQKIDSIITLEQEKVELIKKIKSGLFQKLFLNLEESLPKIFFAEYDNNWENITLDKILTERNKQIMPSVEYPLVSFTVEKGVTPKTNRYNRKFLVRTSDKKYKITKIDDIVYNPANLKFGAIAKNNFGDAVLSPIYVTYIINERYYPKFIELVVTSSAFVQRALQYQEGTVYERMAVKSKDFLTLAIQVPSYEAQVQIANVFTEIDSILDYSDKKIKYYKNIKSKLLNNLFV